MSHLKNMRFFLAPKHPARRSKPLRPSVSTEHFAALLQNTFQLYVRAYMERNSIHPVLAGLGANLLGSVTGAFLLVLSGFTGSIETVGNIVGGIAAVAIYGFIIALPFVFGYGIPIYSLLKHFGIANIGTALVFGALPGVVWVLWTHSSWIDPVLWNGTLIAIFYCMVRQRRSRPNPSFKRDALKRTP